MLGRTVKTALKKWPVGIFEVRGWRKAGRVGEGDEGGFLEDGWEGGDGVWDVWGDWVIG